MDADCLHLIIQSYSCAGCGNQWTHSIPFLAHTTYGWFGGGGGLTAAQERLPFTSYEHWDPTRHVPGCARCVPLQLGHNWTKSKLSPLTPKSQAVRAEEELLK